MQTVLRSTTKQELKGRQQLPAKHFFPIFCRAKRVRRCDLGRHELPEHAFNSITSLN